MSEANNGRTSPLYLRRMPCAGGLRAWCWGKGPGRAKSAITLGPEIADQESTWVPSQKEGQ